MDRGTVLNDKYRLLDLIGQGGMGAVWRAQHLGLDSPVAVKVMTPEMAANPEAVARFTREARAAASLRSPHVVQILDYGVDPARNEPFIVMELLEGESLSSRIKKRGRLTPAETSRVIVQVARALTLAHAAKIVHRDLKPDNIFLVKNADDEIVKVLDFGIAKSGQALGAQAQTVTGSVLGTPYYMSPEQITNSKSVDQRSDLWSLTVIACECLTGQRPFLSDTAMSLAVMICQGQSSQPSSLAPVPPGFDEWFARGTALDRERRFQSAGELSETLQRVVEGGAGSVARQAPMAVAATLHAPLSAEAARFEPVPATHGAGRPVIAEAGSVGPLSRTEAGASTAALGAPKSAPAWRTPAIAAAAALIAGAGVWLATQGSADETPEFEVLPSPAAAPAAPAKLDPPAEPRAKPAVVVAAPAPTVREAPKIEPVAAEPERPEPAKASPPKASPAPQPTPTKVRPRPARTSERPKPAPEPAKPPSKTAEPPPRKAFDPYDNL